MSASPRRSARKKAFGFGMNPTASSPQLVGKPDSLSAWRCNVPGPYCSRRGRRYIIRAMILYGHLLVKAQGDEVSNRSDNGRPDTNFLVVQLLESIGRN